MAKRKLTRLEALKLQRRLAATKREGAKGAVVRGFMARHLKKENEDDVFIVVAVDADDTEVKFQDGNLLVGPFDSEEAARDAAGEDVITVTGGEVTANSDAPGGDGVGDLEPELEASDSWSLVDIAKSTLGPDIQMTPTVASGRSSIMVKPAKSPSQGAVNDFVTKAKGLGYTAVYDGDTKSFQLVTEKRKMSAVSNFLRARRRVAEGVRRSVLARIRRESEVLASVDTDVTNNDEAVDNGEAGAHDYNKVASFVNAADLGPNRNDVPTDQDPAATDVDQNVLENGAQVVQVGALVDVLRAKGDDKVDTGMVKRVSEGVVHLEGDVSYSLKEYRVRLIAA